MERPDLAEELYPGCNDPNSADHWVIDYLVLTATTTTQ